MDRIGERKERIGRQDAPTGSIGRFRNRDLHAVDATHLPCTHADQGGVSGQDNRIALDVPDHLPAEGDVVPKLVGHWDCSDGFPSQICRWQRVGLLDQNPTLDKSEIQGSLRLAYFAHRDQSHVITPLGFRREDLNGRIGERWSDDRLDEQTWLA